MTNPLTADMLRQMDFEAPGESLRWSWSPKAVFDAREAGEIAPDGEYETLHQYISNPDLQVTAAQTLLEVPLSRLPAPEVLLAVYRAVDQETGCNFGAVLPGAYVSESKTYAMEHGDTCSSAGVTLLGTHVFPDELVTFGDPHEFIYAPRSLEAAFERYLLDVAKSKARV
jgi:hypothetical protein